MSVTGSLCILCTHIRFCRSLQNNLMVRDSGADPEFHVCVCGGGGGAQFFKQKIVSSESIGCEAMLEGSGGMLPPNFF